MTDSIQKISFANNDFEFSSSACDCEVDITHPSKSVTKYTYRLYPKEDTLHYAYIAGQGLVNKKRKGAARGKDVLADLLAVKDDDSKAVKTFIEEHGFFLPLVPNENNWIESDSLFGLINRLKATVSLLSALGECNANYEKITALTLYLLLTPQFNGELSDGYPKVTTCPHRIGQVWNNTDRTNEIVQRMDVEKFYNEMGYNVNDSIRSPHTWLDMNEYQYAVDYCQQHPSSMIGKATCLFLDAANVDLDCRLAIDFLYHFCKEVGDIQAWNHNGKLTFTESNPSASIRFKKDFDEQMQKGLLKLAKHTIKTEIEYNLRDVVPSYNTESMAPSWHVNCLLSGLYFSIFYMRPKIELYRVCANPKCERSFLVKSTSHKQKYCSHDCANAMAQHNHRRRKNECQIIDNQ